MQVNVIKIEWRKGTYLWRIVSPIMGVLCLILLYMGWKKEDLVTSITIFIFLGLPTFMSIYCSYRTPYHCIPISRFYNAKSLRKSIESETFFATEEKLIWESEHWLKIKNYFYPKNFLVSIGGSATNNTTMILKTMDGKEYRVQSMGYIGNAVRLRTVAKTLPYVRILNELGCDGELEIRSSVLLSDGEIEKIFNTYAVSHTVEDLVLKTDVLERYAMAYAKRCKGI